MLNQTCKRNAKPNCTTKREIDCADQTHDQYASQMLNQTCKQNAKPNAPVKRTIDVTTKCHTNMLTKRYNQPCRLRLSPSWRSTWGRPGAAMTSVHHQDPQLKKPRGFYDSLRLVILVRLVDLQPDLLITLFAETCDVVWE